MAPTQRVVLAIVGFLGGVLTASVLASLVVSATGWELSVSASIGSELGRTVRQVGQAARSTTTVCPPLGWPSSTHRCGWASPALRSSLVVPASAGDAILAGG